MYCEMQFVRTMEDFKQNVILQDATADKLLQGDCMRQRPKVVSLRKIFKEIFEKY